MLKASWCSCAPARGFRCSVAQTPHPPCTNSVQSPALFPRSSAPLPGGVMKTHNAVSFSWIPAAFSIQHTIQEILFYTFEELPR